MTEFVFFYLINFALQPLVINVLLTIKCFLPPYTEVVIKLFPFV